MNKQEASKHRKVWYHGVEMTYKYSSDQYRNHWYWNPEISAQTSIAYSELDKVLANQDEHRRWNELHPPMTKEELEAAMFGDLI